jgi:Rrf2 family transcriptional regulator, cysteine metabolism repressor
MFTISAKGIYGVSAVLELALRHESGAVQIKDIAAAQGIPQHYLEQILVVLKRGGIVKSYRGAQGGYALAGNPGDLRLLDVITLLEGPLEIAPGGRGDARLNGLWHDLAEGARSRLDRSIEELVDEVRNTGTRLNFAI